MIRNIEDLKYSKSTLMQENLAKWSGEPEKLLFYSRDMRGEPETIDVLKMSGSDLYDLMKQIYVMGQKDARNKIKNALEGR